MRSPGRRAALVVAWLAVAGVTSGLVPGAAPSGVTSGLVPGAAPSGAAECAAGSAAHPEWIFCDDFEDDGPLVRPGRYFEYGDDEGDFVPVTGAGVAGSRAMRGVWQTGEVDAGSLKVAFGRNPNGYMARSGLRTTEDFREIWYRMYVRMDAGWRGDPAKLSRATVFTSADDWSQAMIAHLWGDGREHLLVDPARCVGADDRVRCTGYNDFAHLEWLGYRAGTTPVFATDQADRWFCVEAHVRLNDPGQANGVHEFRVDGRLEARRDGLDFVRGYTAYGLNAVFFENYWNDGSPREQARYFDNIVVSTAAVGCLDPVEPTYAPTPRPTDTPTATATRTSPAPATISPSPTPPSPSPGASPTASPATPPATPSSPARTATPLPTPAPTDTSPDGGRLFLPAQWRHARVARPGIHAPG